jgi:hypothetical protein
VRLGGQLVALVVVLLVLTAPSANAATGSVGFDVSYPQCGQPFPAGGAFAIVGVNAGLPFSPNPCLAAQLSAAGAGAELYANTADPGPATSAHWPAGQATPQPCPTAADDVAACAYDYGWNAALDAYADADGAAATTWWLDVESANSWETVPANNVAAIQGAVDYLRSVGVPSLGIYASPADWLAITGGSRVFAALPLWLPGAVSQDDAAARCSQTSPTGGPIALVQFPATGAGGDVECSTVPFLALAARPAAVTAGRASAPLVVRLPAPAPAPLSVAYSTTSASGAFSTSTAGPWTHTLTLPITAGDGEAAAVYYRDTKPGTATLTAGASGYASVRTVETVGAAVCTPPKRARGFELVLAHRSTKAQAAAAARKLHVTLNGKRAKLVVERSGCTGYRVAIHGFTTRAAATKALRTLRPKVAGAKVL